MSSQVCLTDQEMAMILAWAHKAESDKSIIPSIIRKMNKGLIRPSVRHSLRKHVKDVVESWPE